MRAERVVLDTNVLISAAFWPQGPPRAAVDAVARGSGVLLFSDETFDELRTRLLRTKFDPYASRMTRGAFLARLRAVSEWIWIAGSRMGCRDPDDDKLLETAEMGKADVLVSGDQDLLAMAGFAGIPILSPAAFVRSLDNPPPPLTAR